MAQRRAHAAPLSRMGIVLGPASGLLLSPEIAVLSSFAAQGRTGQARVGKTWARPSADRISRAGEARLTRHTCKLVPTCSTCNIQHSTAMIVVVNRRQHMFPSRAMEDANAPCKLRNGKDCSAYPIVEFWEYWHSYFCVPRYRSRTRNTIEWVVAEST